MAERDACMPSPPSLALDVPCSLFFAWCLRHGGEGHTTSPPTFVSKVERQPHALLLVDHDPSFFPLSLPCFKHWMHDVACLLFRRVTMGRWRDTPSPVYGLQTICIYIVEKNVERNALTSLASYAPQVEGCTL